MRISSPRTALSPFKRYWWISIPAFLLSLGGAFAYLALSPKLYEAVVRLSVEDERTSVSDIGQSITAADEVGGSNPIVTQAEVVKSQGVLRAALDLYKAQTEVAAAPESVQSSALANGQNPADDGLLASNDQNNLVSTASPSGQSDGQSDGQGNGQTHSRDKAPSVDSVAQALQVDIIPATNILEVRYRGDSPQQSVAIVNAVAQAAVAENVEAINVEASTIREFLESQLPSLQSRLRQAELKESQYRQSSGLLAVEAQNQQMVGSLATLEQEERALISTLEEVATRKQRLQEVTGIASPEVAYAISRVGQDPELQTLQAQITNANVLLAEARSKLGDSHPDLLALRDQLTGFQALYQQRLNQLTPSTLGRDFGNVAATLGTNELSQQLMADSIASAIEQEALSSRLAAVQSDLARMRSQFTQQPSLQQPLSVLERERREAADSLELIRAKLEEARIAEAQLVSNVRVVGLAEPVVSPVSPKPFVILAMGAIAGSILSVAAILLMDLLDVSLQSGEEVEKLVKLPVLGYLPRLSADLVEIEGLDAFLDNPRHVEPYRALLKTLESRQRFARGEVMRSRTTSPLLTTTAQTTQAAQTAQTASTRAQAAQTAQAKATELAQRTSQVVVVSSPTHNEGKSSVATCLGAVSAMLGRKTLIVEADPHQPIQHLYLQVESRPGLTDVINHNHPVSEAIKLTTIGRLSVLPYGQTQIRPSTVTESASMQVLLNSLAREYDLILVDTASVDTSADATTVSQMTDGLLLVTRPGYTPRSVLADTVQQLRKSGAPLLGIAMNETILPEEQLGRLPRPAIGATVTNRA